MWSKSPASFQNPSDGSPAPKAKPAPRGCLGLFGLPFLLMGLFMMWIAGIHPLLTAVETRLFWKETPCVIVSAAVTGDKKEGAKPVVSYAYTYGNTRYTGDVTDRAMEHIATDRAYARDFVARHPEGGTGVCRVNPKAPAQSTLECAVPGMVWFIIPFTSVFVAIGGGLVLFGLGVIGKKPGDHSLAPPLGESKRPASPPKFKRAAPLLFGSVFFLSGSAVLIFAGVRPVLLSQAAKNWEKTPCLIRSSAVGSHSGKSTTYSVDIEYEYVFRGKTYVSENYGFNGGSSSGYEDKAEIVSRYPAGSKRTCLVDPERPGTAVLSRELDWTTWAIGFGMGGVFALVGALVAGSALVKKNAFGEPVAAVESGTGNILLKPEIGPVAMFFGACFFSVFWNGITSVFVVQAVKSFRPGHSREWGLAVFMIPFVLVGLAAIGFVVRSFFALFSPRIVVEIVGKPAPGGVLTADWRVVGDASKIGAVTLALEGYGQPPPDSDNAPSKFSEIPMRAKEGARLDGGRFTLELPADMSPTGAATRWKIAVRAKVSRGVNISTKHPVEILPAANPFA